MAMIIELDDARWRTSYHGTHPPFYEFIYLHVSKLRCVQQGIFYLADRAPEWDIIVIKFAVSFISVSAICKCAINYPDE